MTTQQAIKDIHFYLDQHATWYTDDELCTALNRATKEWVVSKYQEGGGTERLRRELGKLMPPPLTGEGAKIATSKDNRLWFVVALDAQWKAADGTILDPVACKPVDREKLAVARKSIFHRPTNDYPLYCSQALNANEVFEVYSTTTPYRLALYYVVEPKTHSAENPTKDWDDVPTFAQEEIIQIAVRMLLHTYGADYATQVQVEEVKAASI